MDELKQNQWMIGWKFKIKVREELYTVYKLELNNNDKVIVYCRSNESPEDERRLLLDNFIELYKRV